jgi:hypothetical protein
MNEMNRAPRFNEKLVVEGDRRQERIEWRCCCVEGWSRSISGQGTRGMRDHWEEAKAKKRPCKLKDASGV